MELRAGRTDSGTWAAVHQMIDNWVKESVGLFELNVDIKADSPALPSFWLTEFLFAKAKSLSAPNQEFSLRSRSDAVPLPLPSWGRVSCRFI